MLRFVAGELYLDQMTNDWAVLWMIVIFFIMNIVLMNLLIAIMSNTCEKIQAFSFRYCCANTCERERERETDRERQREREKERERERERASESE